MTLVWGLVSTLWLPYVDVRRTYQASANRWACIGRRTAASPGAT